MDWEISCRNSLTFLGDMYDGEVGHAFSVPGLEPPVERIFDADASIAGGNVLGRWEHTFSNASDVTLQLYYDRIEREEAVIRVRANTVDVDFQHRLGIGARQEVVWGFGYRSMSDKLDNTFTFSFNPDSRSWRLRNSLLLSWGIASVRRTDSSWTSRRSTICTTGSAPLSRGHRS